ncbi:MULTISPECIES: hypothetical protein [Staphylococcus]|uniref:hypothetical protein n=1 Tax=Staphylococcus TaxID=1279 RepID=UPI0014446E32|nr:MULTISPECIES: hypothetical protein [Staphylococcus]
MYYIMCQPAVKRFKWEVEVAINDLLRHGVRNIVLLFTKHDDSVVQYFKDNYDIEIQVYEDKREDKEYIPSVKPYLMYRYLNENSERENKTYFFMDSDVVFREIPNYDVISFDNKNWYGSNCNGYLNYDYMSGCTNKDLVINGLADIVGITPEQIKSINDDAIGAQYIIVNPKAEYFNKVYQDSIAMWNFIKSVQTDFQKWTVEMFATLWNMLFFNIQPHVHAELDFCFATSPIEDYYKVKILHNAGVTPEMNDLFFKGGFIHDTPIDKDLSYVNKNKASYAYTQKIKRSNRKPVEKGDN